MNPVVVALALAPLLAHGLGGGPVAGVAAGSAAVSARVAIASAPVLVRPAAQEQPGARFAAAVRGRLQAGWHVRDVVVDQPDAYADEADASADGRAAGADRPDHDRATVELLLASSTDAERHILRFDGAVPASYRVLRVAPPAELRTFPGEPELAATLASPVTRLSDECGMPVLHAGDDAVVIDADDSYVVERTATGPAAAAMVADALATSLLREVEDLSPIDARTLTALRFHLDDGQSRDLRVELGAGGSVVRAEVRRVRHQFRDRYYARDAALRKAVRGSGGVARIVEEAGGRFVLVLAGGTRYLVADGDFAWEPDADEDADLECSC